MDSLGASPSLPADVAGDENPTKPKKSKKEKTDRKEREERKEKHDTATPHEVRVIQGN